MSEEAIVAHIVSTSIASDLGYRALIDLAAATVGIDYRVVGGHMVSLLLHAYPSPKAILRATADADAGIETEVAAQPQLHNQLAVNGYSPEPEFGNRYLRTTPQGDATIDVLLPWGTPGKTKVVEGRGFDQVPGLSLALSKPPLRIHATIRLTCGDIEEAELLVPDVECAVVLKSLAWKNRTAPKDVADLVTLFEIAEEHRSRIGSWRLGDEPATGNRKDAMHALQMLSSSIDRGLVAQDMGVPSPARLAALIRKHVGL